MDNADPLIKELLMVEIDYFANRYKASKKPYGSHRYRRAMYLEEAVEACRLFRCKHVAGTGCALCLAKALEKLRET